MAVLGGNKVLSVNSSPLDKRTLSRWVDQWTADDVLLEEKGGDSALKDMFVEGSDEELGGDGVEMS